MNPEDIKIGQKYTLTLLAIDKERCRRPALFETPTGKKYFISPEDFESVSPENGIKNTEPAPKYDPCRKFRKGDRVRVVEYKGRKNTICLPVGAMATVAENEEDCACVEVFIPDDETESVTFIDPAYLKLVTPVEEFEPFYVYENTESKSFEVRRKEDHKVQAAFYYFNEDDAHTKSEAAKATLEHCDRLNAEYRKEQK